MNGVRTLDFLAQLKRSHERYRAEKRCGPLTVQFHYGPSKDGVRAVKAKIIEQRRDGNITVTAEYECAVDESPLTALGFVM